MPVIQMTPTERGRIVEYLTSAVDTSELAFEGAELRPLPDRDLVEEGRELSKALRCVNCHNIPAQQPEWEAIPTLRDGPIDWTQSCLTPLAASDTDNDEADEMALRRRPDFSTHFSEADQLAIQSYAESLAAATNRLSSIAIGERLLEQRNCQSCHDRDGSRGVSAWAGRISLRVDELDGRSQDLVPPNLTAIGGKLRDDIIDRALSRRMEDRRLPWLSVRMPRFEHSEEELNALRSDLVSRDRIPAGAPRSLQLADVPETITPEQRELSGRSLVGAGGWSCIACHQVGDYRPKNVAHSARAAPTSSAWVNACGPSSFCGGASRRSESFPAWRCRRTSVRSKGYSTIHSTSKWPCYGKRCRIPTSRPRRTPQPLNSCWPCRTESLR